MVCCSRAIPSRCGRCSPMILTQGSCSVRRDGWSARGFVRIFPNYWSWGPAFFESEFAVTAAIQVGFGLLFLGLAIAGLRPLRGSSWPGAEPRAGWWTRMRGRLRAVADARAARALAHNELLVTRSNRPACGENPMFWKERYTRIGGGLRWPSSRPVALFFSVLLGCYLFDVAAPLVWDVIRGKWSSRLLAGHE